MNEAAKNRLFYFGILPALFFQLIGALFYFVIYEDSNAAQIIYSGTKLLLVLWPFFWLRSIKKTFPSPAPGHVRSAVLGTGLGILLAGFILAIFFIFEDFFASFASQISQKAESLGVVKHYLLFGIFLSLLHSLIEEYYWRWFILSGLLLKLQKVPAMIIGSAAFASHHAIVTYQFSSLPIALFGAAGVFAIGYAWSHLYLKTKSLIGPWISHIFADAAIMLIGYLLIFG